MATSDLINLSGLIDDAKCFALVRQHRWPEGVRCAACGRESIRKCGVLASEQAEEGSTDDYNCLLSRSPRIS